MDIVRETFKLDVILVADSGFRRKDLLRWLKKVEGMDLVIRIEGKLTILAGGSKGEKLRSRFASRFSRAKNPGAAGARPFKRPCQSRSKPRELGSQCFHVHGV